mmetsp:Transcript_13337/g.36666  ORF Transcript_13337/g.36666 Transcript_13337/m.36666 type:complete len:107 (-) Transcript_13337:3-323(-)
MRLWFPVAHTTRRAHIDRTTRIPKVRTTQAHHGQPPPSVEVVVLVVVVNEVVVSVKAQLVVRPLEGTSTAMMIFDIMSHGFRNEPGKRTTSINAWRTGYGLEQKRA